MTDFLCFAEDQQKAARSSAGRNERPAEPSTLDDREMTRNTAMRSRNSISESAFGCGSDFYCLIGNHERSITKKYEYIGPIRQPPEETTYIVAQRRL